MRPLAWYWASFADDTGHLGCALIRGCSIVDAAQEAWDRGCNPGGEVAAWMIPDEEMYRYTEELRWKLMSQEEWSRFEELSKVNL